MIHYAIDDRHGNLLTTGLSYRDVWETAQRIANEHEESVYVYEVRIGGDNDEQPSPVTEVKPRE
jgi:hypothetical protein